MPYSPPASPIDTTWAGANAYGGAGPTITAAWGTTQYIDAPGFSSQAVGALTVTPQYLRAAPAGIDSSTFGTAYVLPPYGYKPPSATINATWVGAPVYAGVLPPVSASWSPTIKLVTPPGLAPPAMGTTVVIQQQFIAPAGIAPAGVGATVYVLHYYQYLPPTSPLSASWVGKGIYNAPTSPPINAAFTPPISGGGIAPIGIDSTTSGAPTVYNFLTPVTGVGGIAPGAFGSTAAYNLLQFVAPAGFSSMVLGSATVAYRFPTQNIAASGIYQGGVGVPSVSPRYILASGFVADTYGSASVQLYTRNVQPAGFDTFASGANSVELKHRALLATGVDSQSFGTAAVVNNARVISGVTAGTGDYGRPIVWFRVRSVLAEGSALGAFGTQNVSHRNRSVSVFGWNSLRHGLQAVKDPAPEPPAARALIVSGIAAPGFGTAQINPRRVYPGGFVGTGWGVPFIRDNVIAPLSFFINDLARFGVPFIPNPQYVAQAGDIYAPELHQQVPNPFVSPYTLRISEDINGHELDPRYRFNSTSTPSAPTVSHRHRAIYLVGYVWNENTLGPQLPAPTVTLKNRTIYPSGWDSMTDQNSIEVLGGTLFINPYWGRDSVEDYPEFNFDTAEYGRPNVHAFEPFVKPPGSNFLQFGAPRVELFIRTLNIEGIYSARMPEGTRASYSPIHVGTLGANSAIFGLAWASHRVRSVAAAGISPPAFYPAAEALIYNRLNPKPDGFVDGAFGSHVAQLAQNGTLAGLGDTSVFGRARVGACAC